MEPGLAPHGLRVGTWWAPGGPGRAPGWVGPEGLGWVPGLRPRLIPRCAPGWWAPGGITTAVSSSKVTKESSHSTRRGYKLSSP